MVENSILYISDQRVSDLLDWKTTFETTQAAMESVSKKGSAFQSRRQKTNVGQTDNLLYSMPGYLQNEDGSNGSLACKLVTFFPGNEAAKVNLPNIMANIVYMDEKTGQLKAIIAGTEITSWRTAAASAVATKYIKKDLTNGQGVLAVLGASTQGKYHALAFKNLFDFKEIRIWNRTPAKAEALVDELRAKLGGEKGQGFTAAGSPEECVRGADVVVTVTSSDKPILQREWLKKGVHINAVGVSGLVGRELDEATYRSAKVYVDHWLGAENELGDLRDEFGVKFEGQVGDVILGSVSVPDDVEVTVFQSLGMAVEDCAMARLIYDLHLAKRAQIEA